MVTQKRDEEAETLPNRSLEWDVDAAFSRIAGQNVEGLKEHLHEVAQEYREAEDLHLSFDEVQTAVGSSSAQALTQEQRAHIKNCQFCKELIDAVVGSGDAKGGPPEAGSLQLLHWQT
jgi:hypothetical protein